MWTEDQNDVEWRERSLIHRYQPSFSLRKYLWILTLLQLIHIPRWNSSDRFLPISCEFCRWTQNVWDGAENDALLGSFSQLVGRNALLQGACTYVYMYIYIYITRAYPSDLRAFLLRRRLWCCFRKGLCNLWSCRYEETIRHGVYENDACTLCLQVRRLPFLYSPDQTDSMHRFQYCPPSPLTYPFLPRADSLLFMRFAKRVTPVNNLLFYCHLSNETVQLYQLQRSLGGYDYFATQNVSFWIASSSSQTSHRFLIPLWNLCSSSSTPALPSHLAIPITSHSSLSPKKTRDSKPSRHPSKLQRRLHESNAREDAFTGQCEWQTEQTQSEIT